jgi:hypothetical protein
VNVIAMVIGMRSIRISFGAEWIASQDHAASLPEITRTNKPGEHLLSTSQ